MLSARRPNAFMQKIRSINQSINQSMKSTSRPMLIFVLIGSLLLLIVIVSIIPMLSTNQPNHSSIDRSISRTHAILPPINQWSPPIDQSKHSINAGKRSQKPDDLKSIDQSINKPHSQRVQPIDQSINDVKKTLNQPTDQSIDHNSKYAKSRMSIVRAFHHAYSHYEQHCFGEDDYRPISQSCSNWMKLGLTILDSLSTLKIILIGEASINQSTGDENVQTEIDALTRSYARARQWVDEKLDFSKATMMTSFFETTIRALGGLTSIYDLTNDKVYINQAEKLADRLMPVFNTPTGLPLATIDLSSGATSPLSWTGGASLLAEVGTCQIEFFTVSARTGVDKYYKATQKPIDLLEKSHPQIPGLYPIYMSPQNGAFTNNRVAWGAMGDSFYEYLLKMYLLTGRTHEQYRTMYLQSIDSMLTHLYSHTPSGLAYIADLDNGQKDHKMDHLVCFAPGMLALGVAHNVVEGEAAKRHMDAAKELMLTCKTMYSSQSSGIGAEYSRFTPEITPGHDASYKLRPETVESLMILYRITKDEKYRDWGVEIWDAIDRHCRVDAGYAALMDVRDPSRKEDKMESFFLAETLKYLYLLFSDDTLIPIMPTPENSEYWVFNTEAHPVKAWKSWPKP